ncbi:MAG TPA: hypothetical protein VFT55_11310, partial [Planctomycetota bacterium]|nr:hypothetical protein [Planctomycetota bacterium]
MLSSGGNNTVWALTTLPNGDLVAGGVFTTAGGVSVNHIARWNGTSWSGLGSGMSGPVLALTTLPNGDLVAGGIFATAGGVSAYNIARWDGTSWSALGSGLGAGGAHFVRALAVLPNGDLVAGGFFPTAGGVSASNIAHWNGTSWSALGSGISGTAPPSPSVIALTALPNGDLVAGGRFTTAGGVSANNIARWNGTSWSALGSGMTVTWPYGGATVDALTTLPNGDLVAGGCFTTAGGVSADRIARWNGTSWSALSSGMNSYVSALTTLPNGDLVAGGNFTPAGGVA